MISPKNQALKEKVTLVVDHRSTAVLQNSIAVDVDSRSSGSALPSTAPKAPLPTVKETDRN